MSLQQFRSVIAALGSEFAFATTGCGRSVRIARTWGFSVSRDLTCTFTDNVRANSEETLKDDIDKEGHRV